MIYWWLIGDILVRYWWYIGDILVIYWWYQNKEQQHKQHHWWCHWWCYWGYYLPVAVLVISLVMPLVTSLVIYASSAWAAACRVQIDLQETDIWHSTSTGNIGNTSDILVIHWWYTGDILVIYWWYIGDILMIYWWCIGDMVVVYWWHQNKKQQHKQHHWWWHWWYYWGYYQWHCWWYHWWCLCWHHWWYMPRLRGRLHAVSKSKNIIASSLEFLAFWRTVSGRWCSECTLLGVSTYMFLGVVFRTCRQFFHLQEHNFVIAFCDSDVHVFWSTYKYILHFLLWSIPVNVPFWTTSCLENWFLENHLGEHYVWQSLFQKLSIFSQSLFQNSAFLLKKLIHHGKSFTKYVLWSSIGV